MSLRICFIIFVLLQLFLISCATHVTSVCALLLSSSQLTFVSTVYNNARLNVYSNLEITYGCTSF